MRGLLHLIKAHAREHPGRAAIIWEGGELDYAGLAAEVERVAELLDRSGLRTLALVADNGPAWAVLDLAALEADLCLVPLPRFFSAGQAQHALRRQVCRLWSPMMPMPIGPGWETRSLVHPAFRGSSADKNSPGLVRGVTVR